VVDVGRSPGCLVVAACGPLVLVRRRSYFLEAPKQLKQSLMMDDVCDRFLREEHGRGSGDMIYGI